MVFQLCEPVVRTRYLIDVGVELSCGVSVMWASGQGSLFARRLFFSFFMCDLDNALSAVIACLPLPDIA